MFSLNIHTKTQTCNQMAKAIDEEEKVFNTILSSSGPLPLEELDKIEKKAKDALLQLKQSSADSAKKIWIIHSLSFLAALLSTGSSAISSAVENPVVKWAVFSVGAASIWLDFAAGTYINSATILHDEENAALALIILEGIKQGKILKKAIKSLKKIEQEIQKKEEPEENKINPEYTIINTDDKEEANLDLNEQISQFLTAYEQLKYKSDEVYSKIVPHLIKKALPDQDPLKEDLRKLEVYGKLVATSTIRQSLPIDYMHSSSSFDSPKPSLHTVKWQAEERAKTEDSESSEVHKEYASCWLQLRYNLMHRFSIHRSIPYLKTNELYMSSSQASILTVPKKQES